MKTNFHTFSMLIMQGRVKYMYGQMTKRMRDIGFVHMKHRLTKYYFISTAALFSAYKALLSFHSPIMEKSSSDLFISQQSSCS